MVANIIQNPAGCQKIEALRVQVHYPHIQQYIPVGIAVYPQGYREYKPPRFIHTHHNTEKILFAILK